MTDELRERLAALVENLTDAQDAAWTKYMAARGATSEALWQGRYEGHNHALRQLRAALNEGAAK